MPLQGAATTMGDTLKSLAMGLAAAACVLAPSAMAPPEVKPQHRNLTPTVPPLNTTDGCKTFRLHWRVMP